MNEVFYSSIFGELTKQVQIRIDAASELRKRLFDQNIYERFLDWDTPTVGLNFEELIGSYNLSVAAATLDSKGKEPIMGTEGLETIKQKVLTHQMSYSMPIEEYRKVLQILDSRMLSDSAKTQQLINLMWNNVTLETLLRKEDVKVADKLMEDLNVRYDRLFASISGVSTGFPAAPTDLGVKNPPPIKLELK